VRGGEGDVGVCEGKDDIGRGLRSPPTKPDGGRISRKGCRKLTRASSGGGDGERGMWLGKGVGFRSRADSG